MGDSDIVYPPGCKPITEDLGTDELIRRLKNLTHHLQSMTQDDGHTQYIPLALHLTDGYFFAHPSKDVQLLVACCIADMLRVFAPDAPYKDQDQIKTIFQFFIKQLQDLKDPKDPAFNRYFYLLENLAYVKSFNMCFEIEDSQEIFCELFSLMFKIVNDEHSATVKNCMLDVLCPLITEADNVSFELLEIILTNIVEPNKSQKKNAYKLTKDLIIKTSDTLETYIKLFFNQILIMEKTENTYEITNKIYDVIYELHVINPSILCSILPQLECKLKTSDEAERLKVVSLLARMFSEKNSNLSKKYVSLWKQFLGRFYDISVSIRIKCVQSTMHFLLNHPHLKKDIIETLKIRQHDSDETVRYEVVMAIVETAKRDFQIVSESEDLLNFVKERTLDKKFKIRKEALKGLALIYKKHLNDSNVPEATKKAVHWIKDKILHGYYRTGIEDRLLVERLLITCLVPYQLPDDERMKKLYQLLGTIDENATKAFIELQKNQLKVRKSVADWVKLHRVKEQTPQHTKELSTKCAIISKQLPDPIKSMEYLSKFSNHMKKDPILLRDMETILKKDVTCKECAETMSNVLKKLGQPIMTNLYYNTIKMLLERIASVMVDKDSVEVLVGLIEDCMKGGSTIEEVGLPKDTASERGLKILCVVAYLFSAHFQHESILQHMIALINIDVELAAPYILKAFTYLGRYEPLCDTHPKILEELIPLCKDFALIGTPKQAKHAIRCVYVNTQKPEEDNVCKIFPEIVESFKTTLNPENEKYQTAIVCLGHIAYNLPEKFQAQIKNIIAKKIVKELLIRKVKANRENLPKGDWCEEAELPEETKCKVEGLKAMARWLLGLKTDVLSAQKTFRMLTAFIKQHGDLLEQEDLTSAEMSWLRLTAGKAMLKVCEQKGVGDQFTAEQFYYLSTLMIDPVTEVREIFAKKLHKGLNKGIPQKCLPLDFMGYYALAGRETDKRLAMLLKTYIEGDITRRREYVKSFASANLLTVEKAMKQLPHILPDYMLVFAVAILAHDPNFTDPEDLRQLKMVEKCLWIILEPLITNKEFFCMSFFRNIMTRIKNHKDALRPDDEVTNKKIWTICDLTLLIIASKVPILDSKDINDDVRIPSMYYKAQENFYNMKTYITNEIYNQLKKIPTVIAVHKYQDQKRKISHKSETDDENEDNDSEADESEEYGRSLTKRHLFESKIRNTRSSSFKSDQSKEGNDDDNDGDLMEDDKDKKKEETNSDARDDKEKKTLPSARITRNLRCRTVQISQMSLRDRSKRVGNLGTDEDVENENNANIESEEKGKENGKNEEVSNLKIDKNKLPRRETPKPLNLILEKRDRPIQEGKKIQIELRMESRTIRNSTETSIQAKKNIAGDTNKVNTLKGSNNENNKEGIVEKENDNNNEKDKQKIDNLEDHSNKHSTVQNKSKGNNDEDIVEIEESKELEEVKSKKEMKNKNETKKEIKVSKNENEREANGSKNGINKKETSGSKNEDIQEENKNENENKIIEIEDRNQQNETKVDDETLKSSTKTTVTKKDSVQPHKDLRKTDGNSDETEPPKKKLRSSCSTK